MTHRSPLGTTAGLFLVAPLLAASILAQGGGGPPPPGPIPPPPVPAGNPITPAKTNLGKVLFWDEQLSSNNTMACGSCHVPARGGSDPRSSAASPASAHPGPDGVFGSPDDVFGSPGVSRTASDGSYLLAASFRLRPQVTGRHSQSMINSAYSPTLFWDGRADPSFEDPLTGLVVLPAVAALESQSVGPILSSTEMAHDARTWGDVTTRLAGVTPLRLAPSIPPAMSGYIAGRTYPELFQEAFGTPVVTPTRIAMAIATYERSLVSNQAPFDQFIAGVPGALTPQENAGRIVFQNTNCLTCHGGPLQTNHTFQYIGVRPQNDDLGRFNVTGNNGDRGRMKVPSLRNVELRGSYFHNGRFSTIEEVVDFYNRGGDFGGPNKAPQIVPLGLSPQQRADLSAFLKRPLTDPRVRNEQAPFDHPTLYAVSSRRPAEFGTPTAGTGEFDPVMIANEPPHVGNPSMRIALDGALGGRPAGLIISPTNVPAGTPFYGSTRYVGLTGVDIRRIATLGGIGNGEGFGSVGIAVPSDPLLFGLTFYAQWFVLDPNTNGRRFSASSAVSWTYF